MNSFRTPIRRFLRSFTTLTIQHLTIELIKLLELSLYAWLPWHRHRKGTVVIKEGSESEIIIHVKLKTQGRASYTQWKMSCVYAASVLRRKAQHRRRINTIVNEALVLA
jgi:hypothetical protein